MDSSTAASSFLRSSLYFVRCVIFSSLVSTFLGPCPWSWQSPPPQQQSPVMFFVHLRLYTQIIYKVKYLNYQVYSKIVTIHKESEQHAPQTAPNMPLPTQRNHRRNQQKMGTPNHQHVRQPRKTTIHQNNGNPTRHQPKNALRHTKRPSNRRPNHTRILRRDTSTSRILPHKRRYRTQKIYYTTSRMDCKQKHHRQNAVRKLSSKHSCT